MNFSFGDPVEGTLGVTGELGIHVVGELVAAAPPATAAGHDEDEGDVLAQGGGTNCLPAPDVLRVGIREEEDNGTHV